MPPEHPCKFGKDHKADIGRLGTGAFVEKIRCALELVQTFITDDAISDADASAFEARGIELLIAR